MALILIVVKLKGVQAEDWIIRSPDFRSGEDASR